MKLKTSRKTLSLAVATAFGAGIALSPMAMADSNPFGATQLSGGYMQIADAHAGEGKCGGDKANGDKADGDKVDGEKADKAEGSCGEGKCGEGKCGG